MPKLGEFLHQQQEPFALDAYLLERGYPISRRKSSLNCTELAKALFGRLVLHYSSSNEKGKIKNPNESCDGNLFSGELVDEDEDEDEDEDDDEEDDDDDEDEDRELKWRESSSTSIPQCRQKKPARIRRREFPEKAKTDYCNQYIINKKLLLQTKQLLIDCVREVIEQQRKRDNDGSGLKEILGTDELWKLVCENVWLWSMDSIHEANTVHMVARELISHPELQKEEISIEIGDMILEGIICDTFC